MSKFMKKMNVFKNALLSLRAEASGCIFRFGSSENILFSIPPEDDAIHICLPRDKGISMYYSFKRNKRGKGKIHCSK